MSYDVKVLADSLSPQGVRLTTLQVTFPRFILAELNTHRMLSRNSASSRAIPTEKLIDRVRESPFIPETFNKRVKGMGVGEELDVLDVRRARTRWIHAAESAALSAEHLIEIGIDKSRANRLLEPFLWHTAIISSTEWDNFFALRDHPAAQPEFQITARMMKESMAQSSPLTVNYNEWHLPMDHGFPHDSFDGDWEQWKLICAGRCARVSYDTHENFEPEEASIKRAQMLMGNGHFSPFEHVARPLNENEMFNLTGSRFGQIPFLGNFRGWVQMRKEIPYESDFSKVVDTSNAVN